MTKSTANILTHRQIKEAYAAGDNVAALIRRQRNSLLNTEEAIEIAYDLQSGRYSRAMANEKHASLRTAYAAAIARELDCFHSATSLLEAGVGEGTTLTGVIAALQQAPAQIFAFDLSWSRIAFARRWLATCQLDQIILCTGSLEAIPLPDNSIDIVYTSHAIEPNGGREEVIISELYRVARRGLVLVEPGYELAPPEARDRMASHGYCRNLAAICQQRGYRIIKHELLTPCLNPKNPSAVLVIAKDCATPAPTPVQLVCPRYRTPLTELGGMLYSSEALSVYPLVAGIPCLRPESAILASHYPDVLDPDKESR